MSPRLAGQTPGSPRDGRRQDRRQLRRHGSSMRRTWTVWGPCTPTTKVSSMSEVRDGPVMNVVAWLATLTRASASPSDSQMQRRDSTATWIRGTSESSRLCSRADSNTSVPVSAIPHCAVVTPTSHANSSSRERRSSRSVTSTRPCPTDSRSRCTSGASEPTTRRAPASVRMRASATAASVSLRTMVHWAPTAVSWSVKCLTRSGLTPFSPLPSGVLTPCPPLPSGEGALKASPLSGTERGSGGEDPKFVRIACRISRRASPLRIRASLIAQTRLPQLAKALRRKGPEVAPLGPRAQRRHDAQGTDGAHQPREQARSPHHGGVDPEGQPLERAGLTDAPCDHLGAQMEEQGRDVDLEGADVPAGTEETGGVGEGGRARQSEQLGAQHRADGTGIDRPVRVPADLAVHRTGVETRAAPDAGERLAGDRGREHARAAIVQHHDVQFLRPLVLQSALRPRDQ